MNRINFINNPPPKKQQAVFAWYRTTLYLIALLGTILFSINGYQLFQLKTGANAAKDLHLTTDQTHLATERIKELTNTQKQLEAQRTTFNKPKTFQPASYLRAIARTITKDSCLFTTHISKKKNLQMIGYTESAASLRQFMKGLETVPLFANVQLSSFQPENAQENKLYRFTITAELQSQ